MLLLDDLIGRQRLDDLAELGKELTDAHKRLQDLLARYQAAGDESLRRQIEREIRELRARIAELARKIAEVKARNEVATDWMNMPDPKKAMEQAARLDSLLEKGDARSLAEALAELGKTLAALSQALDKNADDFTHERFPQESRALAEAMKKISDLEGDQRSLAMDSKGLADQAEAAQARRMEAQLDEFLAKAKQNLDGVQRRIGGAPPREAGSSLATDLDRARDSVRQLRRQLSAKEWAEARKESERLVAGLRRAQSTLAERSAGKPTSSSLDSYGAQINEAGALAQDLACRPGQTGSARRGSADPRAARTGAGHGRAARQHRRAHRTVGAGAGQGRARCRVETWRALSWAALPDRCGRPARICDRAPRWKDRAVPKKRPSAWPSCASRWASVQWAARARPASRCGFLEPTSTAPRASGARN